MAEMVSKQDALILANTTGMLFEPSLGRQLCKTIIALYDQLEAKLSDALREENERLRNILSEVILTINSVLPDDDTSDPATKEEIHAVAQYATGLCVKTLGSTAAQAALDARGAETTEER